MPPLNPLSMPLVGHHLIEASAGTGKTHTIGSLVLRLLLGHRDHATGNGPTYTLEQLLIVTFTNAATEELLGRIRVRIQQAVDVFGGQESNNSFLQSLIADSHDRELDCSRLQAALKSLDCCSVFTIHGFAQRILKRNAFETLTSFSAELDEGAQRMVSDTILDFWRKQVYPLGNVAADRVLASYASPTDLARLVAQLSKHQALHLDNEPEQDWQTLLEQIDRQVIDLLDFWRQHSVDLTGYLDKIKLKSDLAAKLRDAICRLSQGSFEWSDLKFLLTLPEQPSKAFLKNSTQMPSDWPLLKVLRGVAETGDALMARFLCDAYRFCRTELPSRKSDSNRIGFDDLLLQLDAALRADGGDRLAALIRRQYPIALIDEFQDTDRMQWRIFSRIYDRDDTGLLLIGDPKQAIYAFRGADISAYILARRQTASRYALNINYRSTTALIEAVNGLFQWRDDGNAFLFGDDICYDPVEAGGEPDKKPLTVRGEIMTGLRCFAPTDFLSRGEFLHSMAEACAAEIAALLKTAVDGQALLHGRRLRAADIAVLVSQSF